MKIKRNAPAPKKQEPKKIETLPVLTAKDIEEILKPDMISTVEGMSDDEIERALLRLLAKIASKALPALIASVGNLKKAQGEKRKTKVPSVTKPKSIPPSKQMVKTKLFPAMSMGEVKPSTFNWMKPKPKASNKKNLSVPSSYKLKMFRRRR
jgi:hypothetical protein